MIQRGKRYENTRKFEGEGKLKEGSLRTFRILLPAALSPLVKEVNDIN